MKHVEVFYGILCLIGIAISASLIMVASNDGIYFTAWGALLLFVLAESYLYSQYKDKR